MSLTTGSFVATVTPLRRRCESCSSFLASDNGGTRCSPCWRTHVLRTASPVMPFVHERTELQAAFDADGLDGLATWLEVSLRDALDVALANGLVPVVYRRRVDVLRRLIELGDVAHVEAARQLDLSRWTVASYRKELRLGSSARIAA